MPNVKSYNTWLREESLDLQSTLAKSMEKLQDLLQELQSVCQSVTITEPLRVRRIIWAINHLEVEVHLLDTYLETV